MATPILAILGPLTNPDGTPARQNGGTLVERLQQMGSVEHTVEVRQAAHRAAAPVQTPTC